MESTGQEKTAEQLMREGGAAAEQKISSIVDSAQEKAVDAASRAAQSARSYAHQQKTLGAEQMRGVANAAHRAAEEVEGQLPGVARSVHKAASRLDAASSSLREQSVEELIENFGSFAREQPALLFGGAVLAGFALSRFLKASASR